MVIIVGGLWVLVERTALGQEIQAVGGNPAAARLAGIDVDRIKILGFMISGTCAALTGILLASRLGSGTASAGDSYLLTAFAAVFLGSATLRDGEFHVLGTLIGALIIAFAFNGLNIFGAPDLLAIHAAGRDPHRRGRAVEPRPLHRRKLTTMSDASTATWDVHVIEFARSRQQRMAGLIHGAPFDEVHDLPFSFVLARRGDRIVLIDTGFMREGTGEAMSIKFDVPYWISPLRMLAEMGVGPEDVTDIVLSHAHFDHMGSIDKFPKARLLHPETRDPELARGDRLAAAVRLPDRDHQPGRPAPRLRCGGRAPPDPGRRRRRRPVARPACPARRGPHHGSAVRHPRHGPGQPRGVGRLRLFQAQHLRPQHSGVYVPLTNAIGAAWDQLKTIDRINKAIKGDLDRLIILHVNTALGSLVVSGDCVYSKRNLCGHNHSGVTRRSTNAIGAAWDELRLLIASTRPSKATSIA